MHRIDTYAIFWLPPGAHFETPGHGTDRQFERLVERFLGDLGGTPYFAIGTQYSDDLGPVENVSRFRGGVVDTSPYPAGASSIGAEVTRVARARHWPQGFSRLYLVFAAAGAFHTFDFHSSNDVNGENYVFAAYLNPYVCSGCSASGVDPSNISSPNGDTTFDLETPTLTHELFEAITDPLGVSWYSASLGSDGGELADLCQGELTRGGVDGANVSLHGHRYEVSSLWSNAIHACALWLGTPESTRGSSPGRPPLSSGKHGRFVRRGAFPRNEVLR